MAAKAGQVRRETERGQANCRCSAAGASALAVAPSWRLPRATATAGAVADRSRHMRARASRLSRRLLSSVACCARRLAPAARAHCSVGGACALPRAGTEASERTSARAMTCQMPPRNAGTNARVPRVKSPSRPLRFVCLIRGEASSPIQWRSASAVARAFSFVPHMIDEPKEQSRRTRSLSRPDVKAIDVTFF